MQPGLGWGTDSRHTKNILGLLNYHPNIRELEDKGVIVILAWTSSIEK
jgi:hypothetical protein